MDIKKLVGIVLLAAGILALAYGGFNYTRTTHEGNVGPFNFQFKEKEHVTVPMWAGVAMAVVGGGLLAFGNKRG